MATRPDRIQFFENFLVTHPEDDFAQYALAMEYSRVGRADEALELYKRILQRNQDYCPGHFQCGLLLQKLGRVQEARSRLTEGVLAARRTGDGHAQREMEGVLADLDMDDS